MAYCEILVNPITATPNIAPAAAVAALTSPNAPAKSLTLTFPLATCENNLSPVFN